MSVKIQFTGGQHYPGATGPTGAAGVGVTGPTGAAVTKLYGNGTLVGQDGSLNIAQGPTGGVTVTPNSSAGTVTVALPTGSNGPTGPTGPQGPASGANITRISGGTGTLGQSAGNELVVTLQCPSGAYPVGTEYRVLTAGSNAPRFISKQAVTNLAARAVTVTLTRSNSTGIDSDIEIAAICVYGTAV